MPPIQSPPLAATSSPSITTIGKVPIIEKFSYGMRAFSQQLGSNGMMMFAFPAYGMILGLDAGRIGLIFALIRIYDAIIDAVMGWLSDNARTRWGRRKPFIFVGAIGGGIAFAFMWLPSVEWSIAAKTAYFVVVATVFYTFYTVMTVPGDALGFELTPDYAERTRVMSWFSSMVKITLMVMPWMFALTQYSVWTNEQQGLQCVGVGFGLLFALTGVLPAIFCKERNFELATHESRQSFWKTVKLTFTSRTILLVYGFVIVVLLGGATPILFGTQLCIYYLFEGVKGHGATFFATFGTLGAVFGLATIAMINRFFIQADKRKVMLSCLAFAVVGWILAYFLITPKNPWLFYIPITMNAVGVAGVFLLLGSILADVADDDELHNGFRREGAIGAFSSFCGKLAGTIPALLGGIILAWVGFNGMLPQQSLQTLFWLKVIVVGFPIIGYSFAFLLMWFYPLSRERMIATRAKLEARRGSVWENRPSR